MNKDQSDIQFTESMIRQALRENPDILLEDSDLVRAIIDHEALKAGANITSLHGAAMTRLEARYKQTAKLSHALINAAEVNMAGMIQVHNAVLTLLEAETLRDFMDVVCRRFEDLLDVDSSCLSIESDSPDHPVPEISDNLVVLPMGRVNRVMEDPGYVVLARPAQPQMGILHRVSTNEPIRSECLIRLDFGHNRPAGLLLFGSHDPERFTQEQGVDLLEFLAAAVSLETRRWLKGIW